MRWTEEEEHKLAELYPETPAHIIASLLNRSISSIHTKAQRLGIRKKDNQQINPTIKPYTNTYQTITREEVMRRDKVELLRVSWSLLDMEKRELNNPNLSEAQRRKQMASLNNVINTINNINKTTPEEFYDEKPDLAESFSIVQRTPSRKIQTRKTIIK